jgi:hypothetical protein
MSPLRQEIESLLEKDGWTLEKRKKYTYAYKDDETERYRVGDRGIRKQRHTNVGWVNAGKRNLVPLSGVKEYLKGKVKGSEIIHGNPCGVGPPAAVKANPQRTIEGQKLLRVTQVMDVANAVVMNLKDKFNYGSRGPLDEVKVSDVNLEIAEVARMHLHPDEYSVIRGIVYDMLVKAMME